MRIILTLFFILQVSTGYALDIAATINLRAALEPCVGWVGETYGGVARLATILNEARDQGQVLVVDAGGAAARSTRLIDQERSRLLLQTMDTLDYGLINITPDELAIMDQELSKATLISSNLKQSQDMDYVQNYVDFVDEQQNTYCFYGLYAGEHEQFINAVDWLKDLQLSTTKINVLLLYAEGIPDPQLIQAVDRFDLVITNLTLGDEYTHCFKPRSKGETLALVHVDDQKNIQGQMISINDHVQADPELEKHIQEQVFALSQNEELRRRETLSMSPEEFMKTIKDGQVQ